MKTHADDMSNRELFEATADILYDIVDNMVTKKDLERFATKDDLKAFATKDDLKTFATKNDLKAFATKDYIDDRLDGMEARLAAKINNLRIVSA
jgi:hypothetical protein